MKKMISVLALLALFVPAAWAVETAKTADSVSAEVVHGDPGATDGTVKVTGEYTVEVVRDGVVVEKQVIHNIVTLEGRRYLLAAALLNSASGDATTSGLDVVATANYTEENAWYVKLVGVNVTPGAAHNHTTAAIGGANEFQAYTGNRIGWTGVLDATGATAAVTNAAARATFPITGSGTLYGAELVSLATKGSVATADYAVSYAQFSSPITVVNLDTVNVTIAITLN